MASRDILSAFTDAIEQGQRALRMEEPRVRIPSVRDNALEDLVAASSAMHHALTQPVRDLLAHIVYDDAPAFPPVALYDQERSA